MQSVAPKRGVQPPIFASSLRGSGKGQVDQKRLPSASVRFGGNLSRKALNGAVFTFQNITEVFLWGFLAQDMVAMWLPRVGTSLRVGREPYDPSKDPEMQGKPFSQQLGAWIKGNYQGLNWVNFYEETKREIATGPGLLAVPALAFMLNRSLSNPSIELPFNSLEGFKEGLKAHLAKTPERFQAKGENAEKAFKESIAEYIESIFVDPKLGVPVTARNGETVKSALKEWSESFAEYSLQQARKPKFVRWKENFTDFFSKPKPIAVEGTATKDLMAKTDALMEHIRLFNRQERISAYAEGQFADMKPLNNCGKTWVNYAPGSASSKPKQVPIKQVMSDLNRLGFLADTVWRDFKNDLEAKDISKVVTPTVERLIGRKWLFGVGIVALTSAYLMRLAFWSQKHSSYEATRMLKEKPAAHHGVKNHFKHAPHPNCRQQPFFTDTTAGLPFGAQPAFLPPAMPPASSPSVWSNSGWYNPVPGTVSTYPARPFPTSAGGNV